MTEATKLIADPADLAEVERIVRDAGTSFYRGMRVLPPDRRYAMYAIYAFCRLVDDIADEPGTLPEKRAGLGAWRRRIDGFARGEAEDAVSRVLVRATQAFGLRAQDFQDVVDGMQMDAEETIVAPDWPKLDRYCDRVASAVGRLSVRAFGDSSPAADEVAGALGRALQLTNILRDLAEDVARGRLYLPREYLDEAGVPPDPAYALAHPGLTPVCERLARDAHARFAEARAAMRRCDERAMRPARVMAATYDAILSRLERRGWKHPEIPVRLPRMQKLWIAVRYGLL